MFWGVTLETGKRYSQRVEESYHLTMAALEPPTDSKKTSKYVSVMVEHQKSDYMVCTLEPNRNLQVLLDLMFVEGEEVTYYLVGDGTVHLTGYLVSDPYDDYAEEEDLEDEESSEEEESIKVKANKRKNEALESPPEGVGKKAKVDSKLAVLAKKESKVEENESKISAKKVDEKSDTNSKKNKNENKGAKVVANNKQVNNVSDDEEDSEEDEEESDNDVNDSLGLIDSEAVEAEDSDEEEDEEEDESEDEESDDSEEQKSPNKDKPQQKPPQNQKPKQQFQQKQPQNQRQQNNQKPQQNQLNSPQNQQNKPKQWGSGGQGGQKGGFQGNQQQKGFQQQKGQWSQSGQKNQNSNQKGGNQWQNKKQFGQNQSPFGGQQNSPNPNFKGKQQSPNFKGQQKANFNQTPKFNQQKDIKHNSNVKQLKLKGGVVVEDMVEGNGTKANKDKFVHVQYVGRLQSNQKVFDSSHNKPFSFRLGRGEVIKGWDIGLEGMKVGGKRKITIPANMGYGNRSVGSIPANSALQFEVELKSVT